METPEYTPKTIARREIEKEFNALSRKEIENRIKAHQGSDWFRPATGQKGINAYNKAKRSAEKAF